MPATGRRPARSARSLVGPDTGHNKSFGETVRDYLGQELIQHDEAERQAILAIADGLLKEMES